MKTKPTPPPIEVRSPALRLGIKGRGGLDSSRPRFRSHSRQGWFCKEPIGCRVEISEEGPYWVAARTQQWPDGSGLPVEVQIEYCAPWFRFKKQPWSQLYWVTLPKLRQLGVPEDGTPMTIYWCLLTEVEDE